VSLFDEPEVINSTPFFVFDFKSSLTDPNPEKRTLHKFT